MNYVYIIPKYFHKQTFRQHIMQILKYDLVDIVKVKTLYG